MSSRALSARQVEVSGCRGATCQDCLGYIAQSPPIKSDEAERRPVDKPAFLGLFQAPVAIFPMGADTASRLSVWDLVCIGYAIGRPGRLGCSDESLKGLPTVQPETREVRCIGCRATLQPVSARWSLTMCPDHFTKRTISSEAGEDLNIAFSYGNDQANGRLRSRHLGPT